MRRRAKRLDGVMARGVSMSRNERVVGPDSPDRIGRSLGSDRWPLGSGFRIEAPSEQRLPNARVLFASDLVRSREAHAGEVLSVLVETLRKIRESTDLGQSQMKVDDLSVFELLSIAFDASQRVGPVQRGGVYQRSSIALHQARFDLAVRGADVQFLDDSSLGIDLVGSGAHRYAVGVRVEMGELTFEALGMRNVIGVHSSDEFAAGFCEPLVELAHEAGVFRPSHPNAIVAAGQGLHDSWRCVRRTVVQRKQFEVVEALGQNAFDGLFEVALGLIDGHQHRDPRLSV